jgi:hypothetical protein
MRKLLCLRHTVYVKSMADGPQVQMHIAQGNLYERMHVDAAGVYLSGLHVRVHEVPQSLEEP